MCSKQLIVLAIVGYVLSRADLSRRTRLLLVTGAAAYYLYQSGLKGGATACDGCSVEKLHCTAFNLKQQIECLLRSDACADATSTLQYALEALNADMSEEDAIQIYGLKWVVNNQSTPASQCQFVECYRDTDYTCDEYQRCSNHHCVDMARAPWK